ncbi:MAG: hypothetical protein M1331_03095 [Candidatus Marsarchaeota archaeon]|nr:hypothetical protein [Candidatus Marsarchaeota archaeon]MCL5106352.1 hypothetical protein [Candidatus Marsarchaeota archaeon]
MKGKIKGFAERFTAQEIKDIAVADIVLILAFSFILSTGFGGIFSVGASPGFAGKFMEYLSISAFVVSVSFVLHEMMHKFAAQHYGAIAGFRTSPTGLMITGLSSLFGFLIGIPGATMIYAHSFSKRQEGVVSLAGPLTNFAIFALFASLSFALHPAGNTYFAKLITLTLFINILLALYNMLPIFPLDGSKIFAWDKRIYASMMGVIFLLAYFFVPYFFTDMIYMVAIALIFSMLYRHVLF